MGNIHTQIEEDDKIEEEITPSDLGQITIDDLLYSQKCIIASLLDELEAIAPHIGQIKTWIAEETDGDKGSNRRQAMYRAVRMSTRAMTRKHLTTAMKTLHQIEHLGRDNRSPKGQSGQSVVR